MRARWTWVALAWAACGGEVSPAMPDASTGLDAGIDAGGPCDQQSDCDDGTYCNGREECVDNACRDGEPPCAAAEECVEAERMCRTDACAGANADRDTDMHRSMACGGDDCDDADGNRYPGNPEICDAAGHDEDCRPETYGFVDADMDGDPDMRCCNGEVCGTDCDDMRPSVSSRVPEVCGNGVDDDCDGTMDEELLVDGYVDADGDGWGDSMMPMSGVCMGTPGFATLGGDCDESDPARNPGATEACDEIDNDCDGTADDGLPTMVCYRDTDGDGYGVTSDSSMRCSCGSGWATLPGDCHDVGSTAPFANPDANWRAGGWCQPPPGVACLIGSRSGDWNCDGVEERRYRGVCGSGVGCSPIPDCSACGGCWVGSEPGCDYPAGTWRQWNADCTVTETTRRQECR